MEIVAILDFHENGTSGIEIAFSVYHRFLEHLPPIYGHF